MTPLIEQIAREVHGALSRIDVMHYLDMPSDTADRVAQAILPIITAALNARQEQDAAIAENSDCSPSYERSEWYECGFYSACATIATAIRSADHD